MKRDFSEYARSMRISTYGRTDREVAQQSGWSTILEIGSDCLPPEIKNLNLFIFLFQQGIMKANYYYILQLVHTMTM